jgi:hypothetical protein
MCAICECDYGATTSAASSAVGASSTPATPDILMRASDAWCVGIAKGMGGGFLHLRLRPVLLCLGYLSPLRNRTIGDSLNRKLQIAVGLLQGEDDILICPVRVHLFDQGDLAPVLLLQLADFSLIVN